MPPAVKCLPPSLLMSFTKYDINRKEITGKVGTDVPQSCIIQIGSKMLHLHAKWSPLMMLILRVRDRSGGLL